MTNKQDYNRQYYAANVQKLRKYQRDYRVRKQVEVHQKQKEFKELNPTYFADKNKLARIRNPLQFRNNHLKRKYGITLADFETLFEFQGRRCAICGATTPGKRNWIVDHCHKTGVVRGILCNLCNVGLGAFKDSPLSLLTAIYYLNRRKVDLNMELRFNAHDFDPTQGASICFPLADYTVEITAAEPKVVKDNPAAGYLELSLTVVEGDLRGMVQKDRLNIFNPSEVAKRIAHQSLSAYCFAINRPFVQDTAQLIGGRLKCTIGPQADNDKYSDVKVIKCLDGSLPTRPQGQPAQAAAPQAPPMAPQAPPAAQPPWQGAPQPSAAPAAAAVPAASPWGAQPPAAPPSNAAAIPPWAR